MTISDIWYEVFNQLSSAERAAVCSVSTQFERIAINVSMVRSKASALYNIVHIAPPESPPGLHGLVDVGRPKRGHERIGYKYRKMYAMRDIMNDDHLIIRMKNTRITTVENRCYADSCDLQFTNTYANIRTNIYELRCNYTKVTISTCADADEGGDDILTTCVRNLCFTGNLRLVKLLCNESCVDEQHAKYAGMNGFMDVVGAIQDYYNKLSIINHCRNAFNAAIKGSFITDNASVLQYIININKQPLTLTSSSVYAAYKYNHGHVLNNLSIQESARTWGKFLGACARRDKQQIEDIINDITNGGYTSTAAGIMRVCKYGTSGDIDIIEYLFKLVTANQDHILRNMLQKACDSKNISILQKILEYYKDNHEFRSEYQIALDYARCECSDNIVSVIQPYINADNLT